VLQADRQCREFKVPQALRESVENREVQEHKVSSVLRVYRVSRE
jgi:hypothetical protein